MEQLVNEMKEVNLQSLTVTTSEEIKHLLEGKTWKYIFFMFEFYLNWQKFATKVLEVLLSHFR